MDLVKKTKDISFNVGDKIEVYTISELTVAQSQEYNNIVEAAAKKVWLNRVYEVANGLSGDVKNNFLVYSIKVKPDLTQDRKDYIISNDGIKNALYISTNKKIAKDWDMIVKDDRNQDALLEAWNIVMGIDEDQTKSDEVPNP